MRAHVFVSGKVQGVYFRDSTRDRAVEMGVTGFVRNLRDGRVEAIFQGPRAAVEELVSFCRRGPPAARVAHVEVTWEPKDAAYTSFTISPTADV